MRASKTFPFLILVIYELTLVRVLPGKVPPVPLTQTHWVSARRLLPALGSIQINKQSYGATFSLDNGAAYFTGNQTPEGAYLPNRLTWVINTEEAATYHLWYRHYAGYASPPPPYVTIDEVRPLEPGPPAADSKYVWIYAGRVELTRGEHHVDADIFYGIVDALLVTTDKNFDPRNNENFNPTTDKFPDPTKFTAPIGQDISPKTRAPRSYRRKWLSSLPGGLLVDLIESDDSYFVNDWVPKIAPPIPTLQFEGAASQVLSKSFVVLNNGPDTLVRMYPYSAGLQNGVFKINATELDVRVVHIREQKVRDQNTSDDGLELRRSVGQVLVHDETNHPVLRANQGGFGPQPISTLLGFGESRHIWVSVRIPQGTPAGIYTGSVTVKWTVNAKLQRMEVPIQLKVYPFELNPVKGNYCAFYIGSPNSARPDQRISKERFQAELKDMAEHGMNCFTAYHSQADLPTVRDAGLHGLVIFLMMRSPGVEEHNTVLSEIKRLGFSDLFYWVEDEPRPEFPDKIQRAIDWYNNSEHLRGRGTVSFDDRQTAKDLMPYVHLPILHTQVFAQPEGRSIIKDFLSQGVKPLSYWFTNTTFPQLIRAQVGLYNSSQGFQGVIPWAYRSGDLTDETYSLYSDIWTLTYPDGLENPIPTRNWEAYRAGIDDVRYLQTLDYWIEKAAERMGKFGCGASSLTRCLCQALEPAKEDRQKYFQSLENIRWIEYLNAVSFAELESLRLRFANHIIQLKMVAEGCQ